MNDKGSGGCILINHWTFFVYHSIVNQLNLEK